MTHFLLSSTPGQSGRLLVDGREIDLPLRRVTFDSRAGELPILYLETIGDILIEHDGVVIQRVADPDAPFAPSVESFLDSVDTEALEQAALTRLGALGEETTGQAFLAALREQANA